MSTKGIIYVSPRGCIFALVRPDGARLRKTDIAQAVVCNACWSVSDDGKTVVGTLSKLHIIVDSVLATSNWVKQSCSFSDVW